MAAERKDVERYTGDLKDNVAQLVSSASRGSIQQNVHKISTGNPKLLLRSQPLSNAKPSKESPPKIAPPPDSSKKNPPTASKAYTSRTTGMEFALIPRGTFTMGSPSSEVDRYDNEVPHKVTISQDFYLGKYEVKQSEFDRVMGFNPSGFTSSDRLPVETVSWFDAVWYCNQLSDLDGRQAYYGISGVEKAGKSIKSARVTLNRGANGYRLPTESE